MSIERCATEQPFSQDFITAVMCLSGPNDLRSSFFPLNVPKLHLVLKSVGLRIASFLHPVGASAQEKEEMHFCVREMSKSDGKNYGFFQRVLQKNVKRKFVVRLLPQKDVQERYVFRLNKWIEESLQYTVSPISIADLYRMVNCVYTDECNHTWETSEEKGGASSKKSQSILIRNCIACALKRFARLNVCMKTVIVHNGVKYRPAYQLLSPKIFHQNRNKQSSINTKFFLSPQAALALRSDETYLNLSDRQIGCISKEINTLTNLEELELQNNRLKSIPNISGLQSLVFCDLGGNELTSLEGIERLKFLQKLHVYHNRLPSLPEEITALTNLGALQVNNNALKSLPKKIGKLSSLYYLNFAHNHLPSLPEEIQTLDNLERLRLEHNELNSLPKGIGGLSSLYYLNLGGNHLRSLPKEIGNLGSLENLRVRNNALTSLPEEIGNLGSLEVFDASGNELKALPEQIGNLKSLEELNISKNQLPSIPNKSIGNLARLQKFYAQKNQLRFLPTDIGECKRLNRLNVAFNELPSIPKEIGRIHSLKSFDCNDNRCKGIPEEICLLPNLKEAYFGGEKLTDISRILEMKHLRELSLSNSRLPYIPDEKIGAFRELEKLFLKNVGLQRIPKGLVSLRTRLKSF